MSTWQLIHGDCLAVLPTLQEASVDAVVTDPPAGINFMNLEFDSDKGGRDQWVAWLTEVMRECMRVLKPGGHMLVWALPRTSHWTATAIENAGAEVRDCCVHIFGSGFPKSLDVSKALDKAAGAERKVVSSRKLTGKARVLKGGNFDGGYEGRELTTVYHTTAPATDAAKQWDGWGTAIKPAYENWFLAQKPLRAVDWMHMLSRQLDELMEALCKFVASDVGRNFLLTHLASNGANHVSVQESAATLPEVEPKNKTRIGKVDGTNSEADTLASLQSLAAISSSIVLSWKHSLAAAFEAMNTCIIATASSPTIDLKTLSSFLSKITPGSMLVAASSPSGLSSAVATVAASFSALQAWSSSIQMFSAHETATGPAGSLVAPEDESRQDGSDLTEDDSRSSASEHWWLARKPLEGSVAANVQTHGVGGLNIDGCRVGTAADMNPRDFDDSKRTSPKFSGKYNGGKSGEYRASPGSVPDGRWPPNVLLTCCGQSPHTEDCAVAELDRQSGTTKSSGHVRHNTADGHNRTHGMGKFSRDWTGTGHADSGGASRFFPVFRYCAKASKKDRGEGNTHPTVKPQSLMQWLCRLITPPGGVILDPFCGSGSTLVAAISEGFQCIGIEKESEYVEIARSRAEAAAKQQSTSLELAKRAEDRQLSLLTGVTKR